MTHDQEDALAVSDRIIVMRNAEIAQQRPDGAMADEQNIARHALRQDRLCFADDPLLRVESALPATDALARSPEECIGDGFELLRWQEAGRRSVVLVHRVAALDVEGQCVARIPAASSALRSPLEMIWVVPDSQPAMANARVRARPFALRRHWGRESQDRLRLLGG